MSNLAFILDHCEIQSPAQQLLDRFLVGHNQDGRFHLSDWHVRLWMPEAAQNQIIASRVKDARLQVAASRQKALAGADAVLMVMRDSGVNHAQLYDEMLASLPGHTPLFIYGVLAPDFNRAQQLVSNAANRAIPLAIRTAAAHLIPMPAKLFPSGDSARKALITVQGSFPQAEIDALNALLPYIGRHGREKILAVEPISKANFWSEAYSSQWTSLLAAAVSRSHTMKGDPEKDGRTQDIVALHLIEKLAANPRGWLLHHSKGLETAILVLDGAFTDINLAVEKSDKIYSAELYRPPSPLQDHFSDLTAWIEKFFRTGSAPDNLDQALFVSSVLERMVSRQS